MPPGAARTHYTHNDEDLLAQYLAKYSPDGKDRKGNALYKTLCENEERKWSWSTRHPWQSWRDYYVKNEERMNILVERAIKRAAERKAKASHANSRKADPPPIKRKRISDVASTSPKRVKVEKGADGSAAETRRAPASKDQGTTKKGTRKEQDRGEAEDTEVVGQPGTPLKKVGADIDCRIEGSERKKAAVDLEKQDVSESGIPSSRPPQPTHRKKRRQVSEEYFASSPPLEPETPVNASQKKSPPKLVDGPYTTSFAPSGQQKRQRHFNSSETEDEGKSSRWPPRRSHAKSRVVPKMTEAQVQATATTVEKVMADREIQAGSPQLRFIAEEEQSDTVHPLISADTAPLPSHMPLQLQTDKSELIPPLPQSPNDPFIQPPPILPTSPIDAPSDRRHTLSSAHPNLIDLRLTATKMRISSRKSLPAASSRASTSEPSMLDIWDLDLLPLYSSSRRATLSPSISISNLSNLSISTIGGRRLDQPAKLARKIRVWASTYGFAESVVITTLRETKNLAKTEEILKKMRAAAEQAGVAAILGDDDEDENMGSDERNNEVKIQDVEMVPQANGVETAYKYKYASRMRTVSISGEAMADRSPAVVPPKTPSPSSPASPVNHQPGSLPRPTSSQELHMSSQPQRRKSTARPRRSLAAEALQIQPLRDDIDERMVEYSPPRGSRAGRYARLVSQGRKEEALERERRVSIGLRSKPRASELDGLDADEVEMMVVDEAGDKKSDDSDGDEKVESEEHEQDDEQEEEQQEEQDELHEEEDELQDEFQHEPQDELQAEEQEEEQEDAQEEEQEEDEELEEEHDEEHDELQDEDEFVASSPHDSDNESPLFPSDVEGDDEDVEEVETEAPPSKITRVTSPHHPPPPDTSSPPGSPPKSKSHAAALEQNEIEEEAVLDLLTIQEKVDKVLSAKEQEMFWNAIDDRRKELETLEARVGSDILIQWVALKLKSLA